MKSLSPNILKKLKGNLIMLLTAIIWGTSFISQKVGMETIRPATFNGIRLLIGSLVLLPFVIRANKKQVNNEASSKKDLIKGGIICGIFLSIATYLQTWGMVWTTSGKSGFITAMYIVFVPFIGILIKKKFSKVAFISAIIALFGLYLLCGLYKNSELNFGDFLTLICSVVFSVHILAIDHYSPKVDGITLSALQFFVAGLICMPIMLFFEKPDISMILNCSVPILYSGVFSCGIAYTLQIIGQRYTDPVSASILMSLESVFALISGMIILGEPMNIVELSGCGLMFSAIILNTIYSE